MADDDYQRAQELVNEINALRRENAQLEAELQMAEHNVQVLTGNVGVLEANVHSSMSQLSNKVEVTAEDVTIFYKALRDLTEQYFLFKNLSTASKNLTMYTDEYYTKFSFYNKLRRITLGYVIGLDNAIISDEALRLEVEKAYLQNTDYWLAYAIMAVMLWSKNEREAANRAMNKALSMDYYRSCVFFLLINLRFERVMPAREWYLNYLDKVDMTRLGDEFQYLLQAYLNGLFGNDPEFEELVSENFKRLQEQAEATSVDFGEKFSACALAYARAHLHRTEEVFPTLREVSGDYKKLVDLLSDAEKHTELAAAYLALAEEPNDLAEEQAQRVENVLYGLINSYDDDEWRVVKEQKRNEAIMEAKGDVKAAQEKFELLYAHLDEKKPLSDLMTTWAFSEDPTQTNTTVKRFTISMMKDRIYKGFERFAEEYRKREPERIAVCIDECNLSCQEDEIEEQSKKLDEYYNKNRMKKLFADKQVQIYSVICLAALLILVIMAFSFSMIALTIAVIGGVLGGFLLWRRLVDVGRILDEKKRLAQVKLQQALKELGQWRKLYKEADSHLPDVKDALDRF
ncbi:MAG: hypothetical protein IJX67_06005 [Oscillospiraceae bacterium]|nr:hypothetical protein [Oscillospiraceae bacterium]